MSAVADTRRVVRTAAVGELVWVAADGRPDARPVTPLLLDDQPAVAYPYAQAGLARQVAAAAVAALLISDDRMTGPGWRPLVMTGRPRLVEDRDGLLFAADLIHQELRKYPPARALIDSPLLRREHWWYVPRLIVVLEVDTAEPVGARVAGAGEVLAVAGDGALHVDPVRRVDAGSHRTHPQSVTGRAAPDGAALLLGHDFSVPDLERWSHWSTRGRMAGGALAVQEAPGTTTLAPVPGLWQRLRRQRQLERACRRALDA